jgi:GMP synthase-like glutamine amidotransferase
MNVHVLQHVSFEGLGEIEPWMHAHGHRASTTQFFRNERLPDPLGIDWLVVMGGPMNVYEYRNYPWLREEKRFIETAIRQGKRVLGICLGAQLIADALGAKVYQNEEKEIGWFPITLRPEARSFFEGCPSTLEVFHWHGDTFDLPSGAAWLAESEGCKHQAFSYGQNVIALQFHLEMNATAVQNLLEHCHADLTPGPFVQPTEEITRRDGTESRMALSRLLDSLEQMK